MRRIVVLAYGVANYLVFFATFLYLIGFVGNLLVPKAIDSGPVGPLWLALLVNALLVLVFAAQHSVMARPTFKKWWTQFVPQPMERSTYVLFTNLALILLFWQWRPLGGVVWEVEHPVLQSVLYAVFGFGWLMVLTASWSINHFDLFGLRQVWLYFRGEPYAPLPFVTPGVYKLIRHPIYFGWIAAFWATPTMTVAHLVFAATMTAYMLVAIRYEERNLVELYGEKYAAYRRRVPMLVPFLRSGSRLPHGTDQAEIPTSQATVQASQSFNAND